MHRTTLILAASTATLGLTLATATAVGASASGDQAAAQAAIDAYTTAITAAGFTSEGPGDSDVLDLAPSDDAEQDPMDAAATACLEPISGSIAADGTFIGETARAVADDFSMSAETESTDFLALSDSDSFSAAVAFVDDSGVDGVDGVIEAFASGTLLDCLEGVMSSAPTDSAGFGELDIQFDEESPDIGDQAAVIDMAFTTSYDDVDYTFRGQLAIARVGRAIAMVSYDGSAEPVSDFTATAALEVLVDSLDG